MKIKNVMPNLLLLINFLVFWYNKIGGWWAYDSRSSDEIETAYQRNNTAEIEILICGSLYCIDFQRNIQYSKDNSSRKRKIKRDIRTAVGFTKGVAGISNATWR